MGGRRKKSKKPFDTKAEQRLSEATFYVDECLGRHDVANALRTNGWTVEPWHAHFESGTPDEVWLPFVGEKGWVALTKDKAIRRREAELDAVIAHGVRMFALPNGSLSGQQMAELFLGAARHIGRTLHKNRGAFVASVSTSGVTILRSSSAPDHEPEAG